MICRNSGKHKNTPAVQSLYEDIYSSCEHYPWGVECICREILEVKPEKSDQSKNQFLFYFKLLVLPEEEIGLLLHNSHPCKTWSKWIIQFKIFKRFYLGQVAQICGLEKWICQKYLTYYIMVKYVIKTMIYKRSGPPSLILRLT